MIKTLIVSILILFIGGIIFYQYIYNSPRAKVEITGIEKTFTPAEEVGIEVGITNTGFRPQYFNLNVEMQGYRFTPTVLYLPRKQSKKIKFPCSLPPDTISGNYPVLVKVYAKKIDAIIKRIHVVKVKEVSKLFRVEERLEKIIPQVAVKEKKAKVEIVQPIKVSSPAVEIAGPGLIPSVTAEVKLSLPEKGRFNESIPVEFELKNTSGLQSKLLLKIETVYIGGFDIIFSSEYILAVNEVKKDKVKYFIDNTKTEGDYFVTVNVFTPKEKIKPLISDTKVFSVVDNPPEIRFKDLNLSPALGKRITFRVEVRDDREVKAVTFFHHSIEKKFTTTYSMLLSSGNNRTGEWIYETPVLKKKDSFSFYISVIDSKGQEVKTDKYTVSIVKK